MQFDLKASLRVSGGRLVGAAMVKGAHHVEVVLHLWRSFCREGAQRFIVAVLAIALQQIVRVLVSVGLLINIDLVEIRGARIGERRQQILVSLVKGGG